MSTSRNYPISGGSGKTPNYLSTPGAKRRRQVHLLAAIRAGERAGFKVSIRALRDAGVIGLYTHQQSLMHYATQAYLFELVEDARRAITDCDKALAECDKGELDANGQPKFTVMQRSALLSQKGEFMDRQLKISVELTRAHEIVTKLEEEAKKQFIEKQKLVPFGAHKPAQPAQLVQINVGKQEQVEIKQVETNAG